MRRLARPEAEVVGCLCGIARYRGIVRHGCDDLAIFPNADLLATLVLVFPDVSIELNIDCDIVAGEFPKRRVSAGCDDRDSNTATYQGLKSSQ